MLLSVAECSKLIEKGDVISVAGDEKLLSQLPKGNWIGGTIPYFMTEEGGVISEDKIFVNNYTNSVTEVNIMNYDETNIDKIATDAFDNGFTLLIIPANSKVHINFAHNSPNFKDIFMKPLIGWISGVNLSNLGNISPKSYNGKSNKVSDSMAVAFHAKLSDDKIANIGIINIFRQGDGDEIKFEQDGFSVKECLINGVKMNFYDYLNDRKVDVKYPLVADYFGSMVNVSFQQMKKDEKVVDLYAPVFKDVAYKLAAPIEDYVGKFTDHIPKGGIHPVFSCNCILNFLYSELEGKKTGNIIGPITFGEIAYQLLNQTLTYLDIIDNK